MRAIFRALVGCKTDVGLGQESSRLPCGPVISRQLRDALGWRRNGAKMQCTLSAMPGKTLYLREFL